MAQQASAMLTWIYDLIGKLETVTMAVFGNLWLFSGLTIGSR